MRSADTDGLLEVVQRLGEGMRQGLNAALEEVRRLERRIASVEQREARLARPPIGERPIEVALMIQSATMWVVWENVYRALRDDPRFDVRVVAAPFERDAAQKDVAIFLLDEGVPFVRHTHYDPAREQPDLVIFQSPYDGTRPPAWGSASLRAAGVRYAYSPYGMELSGGPDYDRGNYGQPFIQHAWRIFARSASHWRMYGLHCPRGNDHVRVTGHPKLDALDALSDARVPAELAAFAEGRRVVLYNPQWSIAADGSGASTFHLWGDALLDRVEARGDLALVMRPHPLLFGTLVERGICDAAFIAEIRERFERSEVLWLDESDDYRGALRVSHALVSDLSSLLLEVACLGKPVAYLENPKGPPTNADGHALDAFHRPATPEQLDAFLDMVARGDDELRAEREAKVAEVLYRPPGTVAEEILEVIHQGLTRGRGATS